MRGYTDNIQHFGFHSVRCPPVTIEIPHLSSFLTSALHILQFSIFGASFSLWQDDYALKSLDLKWLYLRTYKIKKIRMKNVNYYYILKTGREYFTLIFYLLVVQDNTNHKR